MKIISWTIRGLNGIHKQEVLRNMIRDQRPNIMLIQETKMKKEVLGKISFSNNMVGEAMDSEGCQEVFLLFLIINSLDLLLSTMMVIFSFVKCFICIPMIIGSF